MVEPMPTTQNTKSPDLRDLCAFMGMGLAIWQRVEDVHYLLFKKLIGSPKEAICSILYFSPPSFESRRVLVDRLSQVIIEDIKWLKTWKKLNKDINLAGYQRGKLAHYGIDYEIIFNTPEPSTDFKLGPPKLAPSKHNQIASPLGQKKKSLTVLEVREIIAKFIDIESRLGKFVEELNIPMSTPKTKYLEGLNRYFGNSSDRPLGILNQIQPDKLTSVD
jgi:hypothetical protein